MSMKMKGLLKGLRYISQIFEEEKEEKEMQIGFPTDVKHVAHIGWDGPSVTSPSWMNEFKSPPAQNGDGNTRDVEDKTLVSRESTQRSNVSDSPTRDPGLPKSSRRQPSMDSIGSVDSPRESPNHKSRSSRRRQKQMDNTSPLGGECSNSQSLPNIPKRSRRKKSKDASEGSVKSSSKFKEKGSRHGSDDGSLTKPYNYDAYSSTSLASLKEED